VPTNTLFAQKGRKAAAARPGIGLCLCITAVLVLSCCSLECIFVHTLKLELPTLPGDWIGIPRLSYSIRWIDGRGKEQSTVIGAENVTTIDVERGRHQVVVAYPIFSGTTLCPAAGLYPFDLEGTRGGKLPSGEADTLKLSFESGYVAETIRCIEKGGYNPWVYPVEKLPTAWEKGVSDPWAVSPNRVAQALIDGTFRKSYFSRPTFPVLLPPDCLWWAESPFCHIETGENGQTAVLDEGIYVFYSNGAKLVVSIETEKVTMKRGEILD